jgi:hypothetical protein
VICARPDNKTKLRYVAETQDWSGREENMRKIHEAVVT